MSIDSNNQIPSLVTTVENANPKLLLDLLKNAEVRVGHLRGRLIHVPGYRGPITFSEVFSRVESVYQGTVKPMQDRQTQYEKDSTSQVDVMPVKGRGGMVTNLFLLPITIPAKAIGDAVCWTKTPYPEVSEEEEKSISAMLKWRNEIDAEFNRLIEDGETQIEDRAEKSCNWKIVKSWDSFLDTESACKNTHTNDENTLANMVETRKKRVALQPTREVAETILPAAAAAIGDAMLTYAKYQSPKQ